MFHNKNKKQKKYTHYVPISFFFLFSERISIKTQQTTALQICLYYYIFITIYYYIIKLLTINSQSIKSKDKGGVRGACGLRLGAPACYDICLTINDSQLTQPPNTNTNTTACFLKEAEVGV